MDINAYVECMSRPRSVTLMKFLKILCIMLLIGFILIGFVTGNLIAFIIVLLSAAGIWFFGLRCSIEFEYQYIDRELTVDKIFNKSTRKQAAVYKTDNMEILAPIKSYHLDEYKNRQFQTIDYSAGEDQPDPRYVMILEGNKRLILEPSEGMVKALKNVYPRKVFTD